VSILRFLGLQAETPPPPATAGETETVRKIVEALDRMEPESARYLAAFAFLLGRVAHADLDVSQEETRAMERLVMEHGGLPEEQSVLVVQIAKTQNLLFGGTEGFLVSREFGKLATPEQKKALLHCLFAVSAADESVSTVEDNEIRRIAEELRLEHRDFIAVRSAFRKHLNVLKGPPDAGS
jgi:uncharacterized tellurite resistance protein B-like protein